MKLFVKSEKKENVSVKVKSDTAKVSRKVWYISTFCLCRGIHLKWSWCVIDGLMTSWLISLVIYLCHSRLMMLGSHQIVQAWGDVYLSICKDYPLSTAVQRCLGCWPCKAGEHISVPYITSSVATWEVKYTAWMGLAWPHYFPMVIVFKGNSWIPEEASIFSLYFSDLIDFLVPPLLLFLVEYQEYWWVRQQVPLSTISSLILYLRASLFPSPPQNHLCEIPVQHYISYLYGQE